jgi:hypothetical protein
MARDDRSNRIRSNVDPVTWVRERPSHHTPLVGTPMAVPGIHAGGCLLLPQALDGDNMSGHELAGVIGAG